MTIPLYPEIVMHADLSPDRKFCERIGWFDDGFGSIIVGWPDQSLHTKPATIHHSHPSFTTDFGSEIDDLCTQIHDATKGWGANKVSGESFFVDLFATTDAVTSPFYCLIRNNHSKRSLMLWQHRMPRCATRWRSVTRSCLTRSWSM